jgi:hypothetical protein
MREQLLDRQLRLLEHLTSSAGIFGAARGISNDPALHGLDLALLHLEARLSHEKRMEKIELVLTRTLDLLGRNRPLIIGAFIDACPPVSISWLENARQFHDFLVDRWRTEIPDPAYLPDVASYEMAYAMVRAGELRQATDLDGALEAPPGAIRRHPGAVILCCDHDIRLILEDRAGEPPPPRRDTWLAVAMRPGTDEPLVSNLSCELFEVLKMLDQFAEPATFQDIPGMSALTEDLTARGLIEVRR